jgi:tetratricopeptide (TPR) repeat protein
MVVSPPSVSDRFLDPITYEVMNDPVVCSDGRTYDRVTALQLKLSPFTRKPLDILVDNVDLRRDLFEEIPAAEKTYRKAAREAAYSMPNFSYGPCRQSRVFTQFYTNKVLTEAALMLDAGKFQESLRVLNNFSGSGDENHNAKYLENSALLALRQFSAARFGFRKLYEDCPEMKALAGCARAETDLGNTTTAIGLFSRLLALNPNCLEALQGRGEAHLDNKNYEFAEADAWELHRKSQTWLPPIPLWERQAILLLCQIWRCKGDNSRVESWTTVAIKRFNQTEEWALRASARARLGKIEMAQADLNQARAKKTQFNLNFIERDLAVAREKRYTQK